jgi:hypothetical protein
VRKGFRQNPGSSNVFALDDNVTLNGALATMREIEQRRN